jgi:hypothetical protein
MPISHTHEPDAGAERKPRPASCVRGVWPISEGALAALIDLGMSDGCIARYFRVSADSIRLLRRSYGL